MPNNAGRTPGLDHHISQKLDEAAFFHRLMQQTSDQIVSQTRFGDSVFTPKTYPLVRAFQYFFSGMLSAWQCVANYMSEKCENDPNAKKWYHALRGSMLLAAFNHLRDSDIHDETITAVMLHTVDMEARRTDRAFVIGGDALRVLRRFKRKQQYVDLLIAKPILELATSALQELRRAVADGAAKGYLRAEPLPEAPRTLEAALEFIRENLREFAVEYGPMQNALLCFQHNDRRVEVCHGVDGFPLLVCHGAESAPLQPWLDVGYDRLPLLWDAVNDIRKFLIGAKE